MTCPRESKKLAAGGIEWNAVVMRSRESGLFRRYIYVIEDSKDNKQHTVFRESSRLACRLQVPSLCQTWQVEES